jgi:hypothetical protein
LSASGKILRFTFCFDFGLPKSVEFSSVRKKVGRIRINGEVPGFNRLRAGATIGVVVDGQEVARRQFGPGEFELEAVIPAVAGASWIELRSDMSDRLSAADQRVASILLKSIELVESP